MWRWYRLKQVLQEEDGIGVVEVILIRCADRSGFNFQITADQSGRDDFRENHQRKFGNIGG